MKVIHRNRELVENPYKTNVQSSFLEMGQCASNKITPDALAPLILLFVPDPFFHFGIDRHVSLTPEKMDGSKHSSGLKSSGTWEIGMDEQPLMIVTILLHWILWTWEQCSGNVGPEAVRGPAACSPYRILHFPSSSLHPSSFIGWRMKDEGWRM